MKPNDQSVKSSRVKGCQRKKSLSDESHNANQSTVNREHLKDLSFSFENSDSIVPDKEMVMDSAEIVNCNRSRVACDESSTEMKSLHGKTAGKKEKAKQKCQNATEMPFQCDHCQKKFASRHKLVRHLQTLEDGKNKYVCDVCGKRFVRGDDLTEHAKTHDGVIPNKCTYCNKSFQQRRNLLSHMRIHTEEKSHLCRVCGKLFWRADDLKSHSRTHSDERPYVCRICGSAQKRPSALSQHMRLHEVSKPFQCPHCEKAFWRQTDLTCHLQVHDVEKKYVCDVCGKSFVRRYLLKSHSLWHTDIKPYKCRVCEKRFKISSDLLKHMRTHSDITDSCPKCGKIFCGCSSLVEVSERRHHSLEEICGHLETKEQPIPPRTISPQAAQIDSTSEQMVTGDGVLSEEIDQYQEESCSVASTDDGAPHTTDQLVEELDSIAAGSSDEMPTETLQSGDNNSNESQLRSCYVLLYRLPATTGNDKRGENREAVKISSNFERPVECKNDVKCENSVLDEFDRAENYDYKEVVGVRENVELVEAVDECSVKWEVEIDMPSFVIDNGRSSTDQLEMIAGDSDEQEDQDDVDSNEPPPPSTTTTTTTTLACNDDVVPTISIVPSTTMCKFCGLGPLDAESLSEHEKQHSTLTGPNQCQLCGKTFKKLTKLAKHVQRHRGTTSFKCNICDKTFRTRQYALTVHVRRHTGTKPKLDHKCSVCTEGFSSPYELQLHAESTHGISRPTYNCTQCDKKYYRAVGLKIHVSACHSGENKFSCRYCDESFRLPRQLLGHVSVVHWDRKIIKRYTCETCGDQFEWDFQLSSHIRSWHEGALYPCSICGKVSSSRSNLTKHLKTHDDSTKRYLCIHCGVRIRDRCEFVRHTARHTGEKSHVCSLCDKGFALLSEYLKHQRSHARETRRTCLDCGGSLSKVHTVDGQTGQSSSVNPIDVCRHCDQLPCRCCDADRAVDGGRRGGRAGDVVVPSATQAVEKQVNEEQEETAGAAEAQEQQNGAAEEVSHVSNADNSDNRPENEEERVDSTQTDSRSSPVVVKYVCSRCTKTYFVAEDESGADNGRETSEIGSQRSFICPVCGESVSSEKNLRRHMKRHNSLGQEKNTCETCGKTFTSRTYLKEHRRIHTGEAPYICAVCGKRFAQAVYLYRHSRSHSNARPYQCRSCDRSFKGYENLHQHLKKFHKHVGLVSRSDYWAPRGKGRGRI